MRDYGAQERSEPWDLETIRVDALSMLDSDLQMASFVCLQVAAGRITVPRRVAVFFADVAAELAELANFRQSYLETLDIGLRDEPASDGPG